MKPKLPDELSLRPAIALAKRMNRIDLTEIKRCPLDERRRSQPDEQLLPCKPFE